MIACGRANQQNYAKAEKRARERFCNVDSVALGAVLYARNGKAMNMGIEIFGRNSALSKDRVFRRNARPRNKRMLENILLSTLRRMRLTQWAIQFIAQ